MPRKSIEIGCKEVWEQISNFLDDEIELGLRMAMVANFKDCVHCAAVLDGTRNVVQLLGDGRIFDLAAGTGRRLYEKVNTHRAMHRR
jgi:hypothetical protein